MDANDWVVRGYLDGRKGEHAPPNFPLYVQAYEHGQQSARDDLSQTPSAPFAERMAAAEAILLADDKGK